MAYITDANARRIINKTNLKSVNINGLLYQRDIYFFSDFEKMQLLAYKELVKDVDRFVRETYKPIELKKDSFFPKSKQKYWEFMNYDVAIYLYAKQNNLLDGYTDTDFFTNASAPTDSDVSLSEILNEYPNTCILHQKKLYGKH